MTSLEGEKRRANDSGMCYKATRHPYHVRQCAKTISSFLGIRIDIHLIPVIEIVPMFLPASVIRISLYVALSEMNN